MEKSAAARCGTSRLATNRMTAVSDRIPMVKCFLSMIVSFSRGKRVILRGELVIPPARLPTPGPALEVAVEPDRRHVGEALPVERAGAEQPILRVDHVNHLGGTALHVARNQDVIRWPGHLCDGGVGPQPLADQGRQQ